MTILTPREREVLTLMDKGATAKQAGKQLGIAPTTVQCHVAHILRKLDVHSVRAAATITLRPLALAVVLLASQAIARDTGQWTQADPAIRDWVRGLKDNLGVSCCDEADGEEVEGWTFGADGYKVKVKGEWLDVPRSAQLDIPNKLGFARVWLMHVNGKPSVRCFIAGAGG